jgi:hypothetical protein
MTTSSAPLTPDEKAAIQGYLRRLCREHGRNIYPGEGVFQDAVYFPWDDPPVGQRVERTARDGTIETGTVCEGRPEVLVPPHASACRTCTCPKIVSPMAGWWEIRWDHYNNGTVPIDPALVTTGRGGRGVIALDYPPILRPATPQTGAETTETKATP